MRKSKSQNWELTQNKIELSHPSGLTRGGIEQCISIGELKKSKMIISEPALHKAGIYFNGKKLILCNSLSENTYSMVFKAMEEDTKIEYAVKMLNSPFLEDKRSTDFDNEIKIYEKIKKKKRLKKHIVKYYGRISSDITTGFIMKYYDHGNLNEFLSRISELESTTNLLEKIYTNLCLQVIYPIKYFHSLIPVLLHRDIKSPNYLLSNSNTLRLCDFNLTREDTKKNRISTLEKWRTTPRWSAPEIVFEKYTTKSDVYSIGIVIWEILYTYFNKKYIIPFTSYDNMHIFGALLAKKIYTLPMDNIPEEWLNIIRNILDENPKNRLPCYKIIKKISKIK